jgi:carbonic anhydrase
MVNPFIYSLNLSNPNAGITNLPLQKLLTDANPGSVWLYEGSLTYPPCNENILRVILDNSMTISHSELAQLTQYYNNNNRKI